jgi:hydroxymethylpyrimidine/phosphomethylpyrimidine kinase
MAARSEREIGDVGEMKVAKDFVTIVTKSSAGSWPVALTVAGSDSGGGAGLQADLKTFRALNVFGTSAITAITCQNPSEVSAVQAVRPAIVAGQMDQVLDVFPVRAAKTGMLFHAGIIRVVADGFRRRQFRRLVVDPVMVATSGALLLRRQAVTALRRELLPLAGVVTPNLDEAMVLLGEKIRSVEELRGAAGRLGEQIGAPVLLKGGHLRGEHRAVDVLFDGRRLHEFSAPRVLRVQTHGTGCTYSAAIAGYLALGADLVEAVGRAKVFVTRAIRDAVRVGRYHALRI